MEFQCERAAEAGTPTYLYGGFDDEALAALKAELLKRFPGLKIAGSQSPPHRELTEVERAAVIEDVNSSGAQVVWVGLGSPKQEIWMQSFRSRLDAPVLVGVGAAFDFLAGRVAQAPDWMQRASLEWLYRVFQDPRRLGKRYLVTLPRFVALTIAQAVRSRILR
jgi:N-acetylglucosaminyldiphosphoundecaprenol N-acetyl-beta-D-mannosaminyltransferase